MTGASTIINTSLGYKVFVRAIAWELSATRPTIEHVLSMLVPAWPCSRHGQDGRQAVLAHHHGSHNRHSINSFDRPEDNLVILA